MLKKLKSVLESPKGLILPLAFKSALFWAFLYLSVVYSLSFIAIFLAAAFYFYFRPTLNSRQFFYSFLVLILLALLFVVSNSLFIFPMCLLFGVIFFFMIGIKNMIFRHRSAIYYLLNTILFLMLFAFFFSSDKFNLFLVKYLLLFFAIFMLFREFINFSVPEASSYHKNNLISAGVAYLISQFVWIIALFPFNFLNASSLVLLILLILEDFSVNYFSGTMNRQIILRNITMFLVLSLGHLSLFRI